MKEESGCTKTIIDSEEIGILSQNEEMRDDIIVINQVEAQQHDRKIAIKKAEKYLGGQKYDLERIAVEVGAQFNIAANAYVEVGKRLLAVKLVEGHGNFLKWLQDNFSLSSRTANNFMFVAEQINRNPELAAFAKAGPSKAIMLLNLPEEYKEEFVLQGTIDGEEPDAYYGLSRDHLRKRIKELEEGQSKIIAEETKALKAENEELLEENKLLRKNQTSLPKTPEWLEEKFLELDRSVAVTVSLISEITHNREFDINAHTLAKLESPLSRSQQSIENCRRHIDGLFDEITG